MLTANLNTLKDGVALEARGTDTSGPVVADLAHGPGATLNKRARVDTLLALTGLVTGTISVSQALIYKLGVDY